MADLTRGVLIDEVPRDGFVAGDVNGEAVLLSRVGDEFFAIGATCTHYSGPLAEGLRVGDTIRCPWHHACFDLRSGEVLRAPALAPLPRYEVKREGDRVFVTGTAAAAASQPAEQRTPQQQRVVIVGGGAAGHRSEEHTSELQSHSF